MSDVDLRTNPVRAGSAQWTWPAPGDPRSRILVAAFREDVATYRTLTVRVDGSTRAQRLALMQEITSLDHVQLTDGTSTRRVEFLRTTDKPLESADCWLPIVHVPSGEWMVAASERPARHWQRAEHRLLATPGCVSTPMVATAVVGVVPSRCDATAIAVDASVTWAELQPWLDALDGAGLLVEPPEVLSSLAAAVHGRCEAVVDVGLLGSP